MDFEIDLSQYLGEYLAELNEQLEELNESLLQFESTQADPEVVQKIFRLAHTIKGSAATMGFQEIATVSHAFEDLLGSVREGGVAPDDAVVEAMLAAFDHIKRRAAAITSGEPVEDDPQTLADRLRALAGIGPDGAPLAGPGEPRQEPPASRPPPPPLEADEPSVALPAALRGLLPEPEPEPDDPVAAPSQPRGSAPPSPASTPPVQPRPPAAPIGMGFEIDLSEYLDEYRTELAEQLEHLNAALLELERNPKDGERIHEIFRIAHTIKGSAATMGFDFVAVLAGAFEDVLEVIRAGDMFLSPEVFQTLLETYDGLSAYSASLPDRDPGVDGAGLEARLRGILDGQFESAFDPSQVEAPLTGRVKTGGAPPPEALAPLSSPGRGTEPSAAETLLAADVGMRTTGMAGALVPEPLEPTATAQGGMWQVVMHFSPDQEMRSVRAFLVLNHLQEVGSLHSCQPSISEVENDQMGDVLSLVIQTPVSRQELLNILAFGEAQAVDIEEITAGGGGARRPAAAKPAAAIPVPAPTPAPAPRSSPSPVPRPPEARPGVRAEARPTPAPTSGNTPASPRPPGEALVPRVTVPPPPPSARDRIPAEGEGETGPSRPLRERRLPTGSLLATATDDHKARILEAVHQDHNVLEVTVVLNDTGERSGARALAILNYLKANSNVILARPGIEELRHPETFEGALQVILSTTRDVEQLRELAIAEEVEKSVFTAITVDGLEVVSRAGARPRPAAPVATSPSQEPVEKASALQTAGVTEVKGDSRGENKANPTVRVTVDRLDYLMNLVAELVISKTQLQQMISQFDAGKDQDEFLGRITEVNARLSRITTDLQEGIMKARMVQIGQVFFRFARLVRDLSKNLGKQVEFLIEGEETELDKTVIDEIGDPLMHLIRNALDHGIETPETRRAKGKPEKGILFLKASHAGDHIVVETADDGGGMDPEAIKASAIRKGLLTEEAASRMDAAEAYSLIFLPGFSTRKEVSSVSGRGVGMDVVKTTVEALGGEIQIKSEVNVGTSIQIKLPLTLAIIQGLLVQVGGEVFTIPLSTVKETIQLDAGAIHMMNGSRVVTFRDEIAPLLYLNEVFGLPRAARRRQFIVFAGIDEQKVGLVVDALIGRREIVIKSLDKTFMDVRGFAGATVLGDGRVSLILDIPALMEDSKRHVRELPSTA